MQFDWAIEPENNLNIDSLWQGILETVLWYLGAFQVNLSPFANLVCMSFYR